MDSTRIVFRNIQIFPTGIFQEFSADAQEAHLGNPLGLSSWNYPGVSTVNPSVVHSKILQKFFLKTILEFILEIFQEIFFTKKILLEFLTRIIQKFMQESSRWSF